MLPSTGAVQPCTPDAIALLVRESAAARHGDDLQQAEELAVEAVECADHRNRLLYGRPEAYFNLHRTHEAMGRYGEAARGFADFDRAFGYQTWTRPLLLRSQTRLLAIGTKTDDYDLVRSAIASAEELYPYVAKPEVLVEYWHRLAIWAMETGQDELAKELFLRCGVFRVNDERYQVAARLAAACLAGDDALSAFSAAQNAAFQLGMKRSVRIASHHLVAALNN